LNGSLGWADAIGHRVVVPSNTVRLKVSCQKAVSEKKYITSADQNINCFFTRLMKKAVLSSETGTLLCS